MTVIVDKYLHSSAEDTPRLLAALAAGQLSGTADTIAEYEAQLAVAFSSTYAIAVASGSAAIQTALHVVGDGTDVLVPAIAPLPSIFPITAAGAVPVPVDIRPDCLDFDPADLRAKITTRTRAALIVPLWGYPIDLTETRAILDAAGVPLIEDAAHAHGAKVGGKAVGTLGTIGCFSTHDRKLLATGEGGFLLTDSQLLADRARSYSRLGNLTGERAGVNFKFNALGAAIGLARLPALKSQIAARTAIAAEIKSRIAGHPLVTELAVPAEGAPNYYNLVIRLKGIPSKQARQLLEEVNQAGVPVDQVKYGYDVFYCRPVYSHIPASCPNAETLVDRLIQLPVHPRIGKTDINHMVEIIGRIGDAF